MSALDDAITALQAEDSAIAAEVGAVKGAVDTLNAQIASLQAQIATLGAAPSQAQIDALNQVATDLQTSAAGIAAVLPAAPNTTTGAGTAAGSGGATP